MKTSFFPGTKVLPLLHYLNEWIP